MTKEEMMAIIEKSEKVLAASRDIVARAAEEYHEEIHRIEKEFNIGGN